MDKEKKLSAARKKLQEYKMNRGFPPPGAGTTFASVNESQPAPSPATATDRNSPLLSFPPGPPLESTPIYLDNQSRSLQNPPLIPLEPGQQTHNLQFNNSDNLSNFSSFSPPPPTSSSSPPTSSPSHFTSTDSLPASPPSHQSYPEEGHSINAMSDSTFMPTPSAPPLAPESHNHNNRPYHNNNGNNSQVNRPFTDAGQDFPVNFFQPAPSAHEYQPVSFTQPLEQQQFFYGQPPPPLFYNVSGNTMTPFQPYQMEGMPQQSPIALDDSNAQPPLAHENSYVDNPFISEKNLSSPVDVIEANSEAEGLGKNTDLQNQKHSEMNSQATAEVNSQIQNPEIVRNENELARMTPVLMEEQSPREFPILRTPTPNQRKLSASSQDEKDRMEIQAFQRMKSFQDALELQLEELRRDNERLLQRQSELLSHVEDNEKVIQDLRRERDNSKEDAKKLVNPLQVKINKLLEENQQIVKNSNDVGMELRAKLQEKSKLLEDLEKNFVLVSTSKMNLAAELDQEKERRKEIESVLSKKDMEIAELRATNSKLEERLKADQQKEAVIHQLEDQRRHYMIQTETLQGQLAREKNKVRQLQPSPPVSIAEEAELSNGHHDHSHGPNEPCHDHDHSDDHDHSHDHSDDHDHSHDHAKDSHAHHHGHDHSHSHDHDHSHHHDHDGHEEHGHNHDASIPRPPTDEFTELKKRLHHLEWENSTFRADVDKLADEAREKKQFEEKCNSLKEECDKLRNECNRLELLVVQLEGENDTIGDYIQLYQSQRLAQKEIAKEKDMQMEKLGQEREMLLAKMAELTQLLKELKGPQADSMRDKLAHTGNHTHQCSHTANATDSTQNTEIEGKIINLLSEISSSTLIENFHPCAVCSGRLMNV